jgi:thiol:disulfide interchange protein DsbG
MTPRRSFLALAAAVALAACKDKPAAQTPASPPAVSPREVYEIAAGGHGFTIGPLMAANTVYVFFDSQCPHCAQLWSNAKPLLGKLKMVWMPVALLGPASLAQGATIIGARTPVDAMEQNEALVLARKGGITANPAVPAEALNKVKANTALFNRTGADSVPLIVFKNAKTGEYGSHAGAVSTDQLAAMAGL